MEAEDKTRQEPTEPEQPEEGAEPEPEQPEEEVKDKHGQPGINKERHDREVKELNDRIAELQAKVEEAAESKAGREELSGKIAELESQLATERKTSQLERLGCIDTETALLVLDRYETAEKLKEAKPFLFQTEKKGSTGAPPAGAADDAKARQAKADKALGIRVKR